VRALAELIFATLPVQTWCVAWLLVARLLPLCLLAPFFVVRGAPVVLSLATLAVLELGLLPVALAAAPVLSPSVAQLVPALLLELSVGLLYAFTLSLPFWALDWAGGLWSRWAGLEDADREPAAGPLAELARFLGVLAFFAADGPAALLHGLGAGLGALPLGTTAAAFRDPAAWLALARGVALALSLALTVALPLALAIWLLEATLAAVQRGFAGLPVASLAAPLRVLLLLGLVLVSSALLLSRLPAVFRESLAAAQRLWS
jgi:flagellar biosynthesis protein FliR